MQMHGLSVLSPCRNKFGRGDRAGCSGGNGGGGDGGGVAI